jgi:hypothetical protein
MARKASGDMSNLFWRTEARMARLEPFFPKSHGKPRVDDRRVLSGIIFINCNGLRWCDAPRADGPHKTLYNRWKLWSEKGVFARILMGLASQEPQEKPVLSSPDGRSGVCSINVPQQRPTSKPGARAAPDGA